MKREKRLNVELTLAKLEVTAECSTKFNNENNQSNKNENHDNSNGIDMKYRKIS